MNVNQQNPNNPYADLFRSAPQSQPGAPGAPYLPSPSPNGGPVYNYAPPHPGSAGGLNMVQTPDLARIAHQGYLQQQQRLVQMGQMGQMGQVNPMQMNQMNQMAQMGQMGQMGVPGMMQARPGGGPAAGGVPHYMGIPPEVHQRGLREAQAREAQAREAHAQAQAQAQAQVSKKKRGSRAAPAQQMLPRQAHGPPMTQEQYLKAAAAAPHPSAEIEPWADALDELDPRENAMARFRARHGVVADVFGPEGLKEILEAGAGAGDPWEGFGGEGESLEEKVAAMERENGELESKLDSEVEAFKERLQEIESGEAMDVTA
ncbi:hypothetical protein IAT38_001440 [Cryptococcus sp. DSM 104549]